MVVQRNFRVVGGGLAGLGVTYHLLRDAASFRQPVHVQLIDEHGIGQGGASAVAGGYVVSYRYLMMRVKDYFKIFATLD